LAAWVRAQVSGYPYYVEKYADGRLAAQVRRIVREFQPDAVQIEYLQLAPYCRDLRQMRDATGQTTPRLILNSHELGSVPRERRARRTGNPLVAWRARAEAAAWRRLQVSATAWADTTLCVTPEDHALYDAMGGHHLVTVPLGMDLSALAADWEPDAEHETYLFVGSFGHRPNVLAAEFLLDRVWPQVAAERPGAQLVLIGRGSDTFLSQQIPPDQWRTRQIKALGFVDDLSEHFRRCRLFVAPLPEGGGIKIKILEAMARGVPVVTTPVGAEGIAGPDSGALTIAACDDAFAAAVLRDAADLPGCRRRSVTARHLMEEHFSWAGITDRLAELYAPPVGS
jgi:glycosyltransferase involved in cell wall biosynthesis